MALRYMNTKIESKNIILFHCCPVKTQKTFLNSYLFELEYVFFDFSFFE